MYINKEKVKVGDTIIIEDEEYTVFDVSQPDYFTVRIFVKKSNSIAMYSKTIDIPSKWFSPLT